MCTAVVYGAHKQYTRGDVNMEVKMGSGNKQAKSAKYVREFQKAVKAKIAEAKAKGDTAGATFYAYLLDDKMRVSAGGSEAVSGGSAGVVLDEETVRRLDEFKRNYDDRMKFEKNARKATMSIMVKEHRKAFKSNSIKH